LTSLPIYYQDETLSSVRAAQQMVESGMRQSQRQVMDHNVAAANILQDYLDSLKNAAVGV
jgi:RNase H-fold protein (predicted Holliday junction resolvase)